MLVSEAAVVVEAAQRGSAGGGEGAASRTDCTLGRELHDAESDEDAELAKLWASKSVYSAPPSSFSLARSSAVRLGESLQTLLLPRAPAPRGRRQVPSSGGAAAARPEARRVGRSPRRIIAASDSCCCGRAGSRSRLLRRMSRSGDPLARLNRADATAALRGG